MPIPRTEELPNGRWRGIATIGGRRRYKSFDAEGEALVWADTEMRQAAARQRSTLTATALRAVPTLEHFVPVFLSSRTIEEGTADTYRAWLGPAVAQFGDRPLQDDQFDPLEIDTWVATMSRARGKDRRSPVTVKARLKALRMLLAAARRAGYMTTDPTDGTHAPKVPTLPHRIIEWEEEQQRLLKAAADESLLLVVLLALDAGLRWEEVYGLHVANVNLRRHRIDVTDVLARPDFQPRSYPKGKKTRPIPVTARLHAELKNAVEGRQSTAPCPDSRCTSGGMLLFSNNGKPVNYHQWKASFHRTVKAAGLQEPAPTFHKLRHTFGTRLAAVGTPIREIADLMGHESTETAEGYFQAAGPKVQESWLRHALEGGPSPRAGLVGRHRST